MGALNYLEAREFCMSLRKKCVADQQWLIPGFPLFYEYDVIRGMQFALDVKKVYKVAPDFRAFRFAFDSVLDYVDKEPDHFRGPHDYTSFSIRNLHGEWCEANTKTNLLMEMFGQKEIQRKFVLQRCYHLCVGIMESAT